MRWFVNLFRKRKNIVIVQTSERPAFDSTFPRDFARNASIIHGPIHPYYARPGEQALEDEVKAELKRITPSNARLLEWAAQSPPPSDWLDGPEEPLF